MKAAARSTPRYGPSSRPASASPCWSPRVNVLDRRHRRDALGSGGHGGLATMTHAAFAPALPVAIDRVSVDYRRDGAWAQRHPRAEPVDLSPARGGRASPANPVRKIDARPRCCSASGRTAAHHRRHRALRRARYVRAAAAHLQRLRGGRIGVVPQNGGTSLDADPPHRPAVRRYAAPSSPGIDRRNGHVRRKRISPASASPIPPPPSPVFPTSSAAASSSASRWRWR